MIQQLQKLKECRYMVLRVSVPVVKPAKNYTTDYIAKSAAYLFNIQLEDLKSASRERTISDVRHMCVCISKKLSKESLEVIGRYFNRSHSDAIYAIRMCDDRRNSIKKYNTDYNQLYAFIREDFERRKFND